MQPSAVALILGRTAPIIPHLRHVCPVPFARTGLHVLTPHGLMGIPGTRYTATSEWAVWRKPTQLPEEKTTPQGWTERRVIKAVLADGCVIVELNYKQMMKVDPEKDEEWKLV